MSRAAAEAFLSSMPAGQRRRSTVTRWHTALDNHSPTREHTSGHAVSFTLPTTAETGYVLFGIERLTIPAESLYIIDNRQTVTAMFPVAWHGPADDFGTRVVLHPIASSTGLLTYGPKRAYHIKLTEIK